MEHILGMIGQQNISNHNLRDHLYCVLCYKED